MPSRPPPLSRTASSSSVVSVSASEDGSKGGSKRTRKRFSQEQLIVLEHVFQRSMHPSKGEREAIAKQTGMDLKSVTIWFQNKRQTERKVALHNSTNRATEPLPNLNYGPLLSSTLIPPRPLSAPTFPSTTNIRPSNMVAQRRYSTTSSHRLTPQGVLSLDRIASRTEQLQLPSPSTPPSKFTHYASSRSRNNASVPLWDAMPSSPLMPGSPTSPFSRDILDFASKRPRKNSKRTLEWACASARVSEKAGIARGLPVVEDDEDIVNLPSPPRTITDSTIDDEEMDIVSTDGSEAHEIITPNSSQASMNVDWASLGERRKPAVFNNVRVRDENDVMDAAWALCGLSAGRF
ncbi:homeobox-domain-containing protein [Schizopora paradoxa]|uniref:Homeobox-domain-containing protein n=1 Tax=Schizopora paradoxa TaxID=27342 RepID=A0A0H2SFK6_9AGAM|nr:homeobox-domain-containing protein [Schizopora paradoxa]